MWEVCPANEHNSKFFAALFLQRLPSHIRVHITHENHADLQLLAAKADRLVAFGGHSGIVAAAGGPHCRRIGQGQTTARR